MAWSDDLRANGMSQYPFYSETQAGLSVYWKSLRGQNTDSQCAVALQVKGEIIYQARRLDSHPSLAIWGGGNEVEASFRWFPDSRDSPQFYTPDYMQVSKAHTYSAAVEQLLSRHSQIKAFGASPAVTAVLPGTAICAVLDEHLH